MYESIFLEVFSYSHNGVLIIKQHLQLMATHCYLLPFTMFSSFVNPSKMCFIVSGHGWKSDQLPQKPTPTFATFQCQTSSEIPQYQIFLKTVAHRAQCRTAAVQKTSCLFADMHT